MNNIRQAIVTKYHAPTNKVGAKISARADAGKVILSWDHGIGPEGNHWKAAEALAKKFDWPTDKMVGGSLPGVPSGYVFVLP
jgi:hypothetical protein